MWIRVKATREGLIGGKTASGYVVETHVPFVALPCVMALRRWIRIRRTGGAGQVIAECEAIVLDVGPHYTTDLPYVFHGRRPRAESQPGGNGAGIDLGEKVWSLLGMTDNTDVEWEFLA
jgi:hypothetical protein